MNATPVPGARPPSDRAVAAVLVAAVLLAWAWVVPGDFVYDDLHSVRDNVALRSLARVPSFFVDLDAFSALESRMYRPVLLVTYAVDYALGAGACWVFKLTNLLLHTSAVLLLWRSALALGLARGVAAAVAAAFALHPLASEAVNTVSGRSELLLAVGLLGGLLAHLRAMAARPGAACAWSAVVALCAAVACGSKETGVVLPALLAVLEVCRRRGLLAPVLRLLLPTAAVVAYLVVRRWLFGVATAELPAWAPVAGADPAIGAGRDLLTQLCTMGLLLPRALAQVVMPVGLTLDPSVPFARGVGVDVVCGWTLVLGIAGLALWTAWRRRSLASLAGVALAAATAAPWVLLPLNMPYLEHRMYAPLAGIALACWPLLARVLAVRPARWVAAAVAASFTVMAAARSLEYRSPAAMWEKVVARQPDSVRGLCGLALVRMESGRLVEALALLRRAVALRPGDVAAAENLVELHLALAPSPGRVLTGLVLADQLVARAPGDPFARLRQSRALSLAGVLCDHAPFHDEAVAAALHCLQIAEPKGLVYRTAASARLRQGQPEAALALLDESIARGLAHYSVRLDRARVLRAMGRSAEARREVLRLAAEHPFADEVLAALGEFGLAAPR